MLKEIEKLVNEIKMSIYVDNGVINNELEKIENLEDIAYIYQKYNEYFLRVEKIKKEMSNCHSDFFCWSYQGEKDTYEYLKEIMAYIIANLVKVDSLSKYRRMQEKADSYDRIYNKINDKIRGLKEYKPTSYKLKIELLESIKKEL